MFPRQQTGFALLSIIIALSVMSVVVATASVTMKTWRDQIDARRIGNQLRQYNHGVRAWLADAGLSASAATVTGVGWLKDSSCGGTASAAFLPCWFPDSLPFGLSYSTSITNSGSSVEALTTVGPIRTSGTVRTDLAGAAALTAASGDAQYFSPVDATFYDFSVNTTSGAIEARASTAPALDAWLRTDGSNTMNADLAMNGNTVSDAFDYEMSNGFSLAGGWRFKRVVTHNGTIPIPDCPTGFSADAFCTIKANFPPSAKALHAYDCKATPQGSDFLFQAIVITENGPETLSSSSSIELNADVSCK